MRDADLRNCRTLEGAGTDSETGSPSWEAPGQARTPRAGLRRGAGRAAGARTHHVHYFRVDRLCDHVPIMGDVLYHLTQSSSLHFLPL